MTICTRFMNLRSNVKVMNRSDQEPKPNSATQRWRGFNIFICNGIGIALYRDFLPVFLAPAPLIPGLIATIPPGSSASSSASPTAPASAGPTAAFRRWTLGPQCLDPLGAAGREVGVGIEVRAVEVLVVVGDGESGADGQPAWTDGGVAPKNVQSTATCIEIWGEVHQNVSITQVVTCQYACEQAYAFSEV